jgi:Nuclease-related domain
LGSASALGIGSRSPVVAGRSRVGARSEDDVQRALAPLRAEGWRLRHSLPWRGGGDIDSVAISPTGIAVAIETKTRTHDERTLARVREQAAWPASCASFAQAASSGSSTTFWWFRSTG